MSTLWFNPRFDLEDRSGGIGRSRQTNVRWANPHNAPLHHRETAQVASTDSSASFSAFFLEQIFLTHFDVVRSRCVVLSMPIAVSKLPFRLVGNLTAAR
jgi:hypothetical protein